MGLRFGLLGPVRIWRDGTELPLGTLKQRMLLTALLLEPNRVVALDRLILALWDERPPRSALANLRTYANRLRNLLRAATTAPDLDILPARHPGYLLRVAPGQLDTIEFAARLRRGREALGNGAVSEATTDLRAALDLWRGGAAEDVPRTPELAARLEAIDEQRLSAAENLMHGRLILGANTELITELRDTVAAHPTRERMWANLMLALYRTGDTAAALEAYRVARRALREHLGIDPGAELTTLHSRILARDPELARPVSGPIHLLPLTAPRILPKEPATFVGRTVELAEVEHALGSDPAVAAIHGPGGYGKSALAAKVAATLAARHPDGQLYVDLRATTPRAVPRSPAEALGRFLRVLGVSDEAVPDDTDEAVTVFRKVCGDRRLLVILDNALDEAQVRPLLSACSGSTVLVTSRAVLGALDGVTHVGLGPLAEAEARQLLAILCGPERVLAEPGQATKLAELCDRQPLALWIAGTRLAARREWSVGAFVDLLADERHRLDALCCGDRTIRAAFDTAFLPLLDGGNFVDQRAAVLFPRLGLLPVEEFGPVTAAVVLDCDTITAAAVLGRLADLRLIEPVGPRRYRLPGLLRIYAAEQARATESKAVQEQVLRRVG